MCKEPEEHIGKNTINIVNIYKIRVKTDGQLGLLDKGLLEKHSGTAGELNNFLTSIFIMKGDKLPRLNFFFLAEHLKAN